MKKHLLIFFALFLFHVSSSQPPGEWMWIHGSNSPNSIGNYGTQGVPSASNEPPAVYEPCEFTDQQGNFWFYGGSNNSLGAVYADLWKYDPVTNMWTWMKGPGTMNYAGNYGVQGVPSPSNNPSGRSYGAATWVDNQGIFWLFGGGGNILNDLWKYDPAANEWTWMKGPMIPGPGVYGTQGVPDTANFPDPRYECVASWTDNNGDLWMFGGILSDYNDLWRYNIATNTWTWMKGSNTTGQPATYGVQGVEDPANTPGASCVYSAWKDLSGNFWMWGGETFGLNEDKNEMWRFNPVTNNWTWIDGDIGGNTLPVYGTQCVADSSNDPGGRFENRACWQDASGDFYFFGGGIDALLSVRNDLWKYCVARGQWIFLKGDMTLNPIGNWGTLGVPSPTNVPDGRGGSVGWSDQAGKIYLFGGSPGSYVNPYNDLWVYTIDNTCGSCNTMPVALFTATHPICPGTCTDFTNLSLNGLSFQWFFPGANPSVSTDFSPQGICYNTPGSYDVTLIATNVTGSDTLTLLNYMTVYPYPPAQGITQSGDTLYANPGATSYQWYHNGNLIAGATDYYYVASAGGNYNVVATDGNGCEVEAVIFDVIASLEDPFAVGNSQFAISPNPADKVLAITFKHLPRSPWTFHIYNSIGERVTGISLIDQGADQHQVLIDVKTLAAGVYYLDLMIDTKSFRTKFIKM